MTARYLGFVIFFLAQLSFAGGFGGGNGGFVVENDDEPMELFDLWYGLEELNLITKTSEEDHESLAKEAVILLLNTAPDYFEGILRSYARVVRTLERQNMRPRADLDLVPPTNFLGNLTGMNIQPLAVFTDSGVLLVIEERWQRLQEHPSANVHMAAFIVHEALGDALRASKRGDRRQLPEDERREIARDTVIIVAHLFSELSDESFSAWFPKFLDTGESYRDAEPEEFSFEEARLTMIEGDDVESAVGELCSMWESEVGTFLLDKTIIHTFHCEKDPARTHPWVHGDKKGYFVRIKGTIRAVPKGPLYEVETRLISDYTIAESESQGSDSLRPRLEAWREDLDTNLSDLVFFREFRPDPGMVDIRRQYKWNRYYDHFIQDSGIVGIDPIDRSPSALFNTPPRFTYKFRELGSFREYSPKLYIMTEPGAPDPRKTSLVTGRVYRFHDHHREDVEREASKLALDAWRESCEEARRAAFDEGARYFNCGMPDYKVEERESRCWFESSAIAF